MGTVNIKTVYSMANKSENQKKVADLKPILDKCSKDIEEILGRPVKVRYSIDVAPLLPSINKIVEVVCNEVGVDIALVLSQIRLQSVVVARHLVCYFASTRFKYPLKSIGLILGRDHTSVIVGRNKIAAFLEIEDEQTMFFVNKCERALDEAEVKQ